MPRGLKAASILARQVDHIVCEMKRDLAGGESGILVDAIWLASIKKN
jgi:hypothetical protein